MKTATIFLVAVTVFTSLLLESSAAPADLHSLAEVVKNFGSATGELIGDMKSTIAGVIGDVKDGFDDQIKSLLAKIDAELKNSVKVDKKLKKFVAKSIEEIYEALTELLKANEADLAKAAGDEKEVLNKTFKRLQNFDNIIRLIYTVLKSAVASGNSAYIKIVLTILSKANEKTKADQADILQSLKATPGELVHRLEKIVKKNVDFIVDIGTDVINNIVSTRGLKA